MHWTLPDLLALPADYYAELLAMLEDEAKKAENR